MNVKNHLLGYKNLYIVQNTQMFNFSLDSVLLPNFVTINKNVKNILDIGTGNAPIPIILTTLTEAKIKAIEIQEDVFELAKESIKINNLENRIELINDDINEYYKQIKTDSFDLITCNPPFFKVEQNSKLNKTDYKTIARHEITLNLEQICKISKKILKNNATLALVHRPDRLVDIIQAMKNNNIEPKRIQFVHPKQNTEANTVLIEGIKNGKPGLKILNPLYVHEDNGEYTEEVKKYFK